MLLGAAVRDQLNLLLETLEMELRAQGRWDGEAPTAAALRSTEPFAVDTLNFDQWLQWILLPRLQEMLVLQLPLPSNCAIQPMAEEVYGQDDPGGARIVLIVAEIDALLTDQNGGLN